MASTSDELDTLLQDDGYSAAEVIEAATSLLSDPEWAQENPKRVTAVLRATQREDGSQVDAVHVVKFIASVQRVVGKDVLSQGTWRVDGLRVMHFITYHIQ